MNQIARIPEYRALMVFDHAPAGCIVQPVTDSESEPHLRLGEFAVIDTTDTEPQNGELYLIRQGARPCIVQAFSRTDYSTDAGHFTGWWTRSLRRQDFEKEVARAKRGSPPCSILTIPRGCMVDGPRLAGAFQQALIGRVVGIYQPVSAFND